MPWLATCKTIHLMGFLLNLRSFWLLCGFCYWQFSEDFISKDSANRTMVNIFWGFWLMISVSVRMNSKNLLYVMGVTVGMRSFLDIEGVMPNFLLTHSAVFLLVWFICRASSLWICPFLTFFCCDIIFPKIQLPVWSTCCVSWRGRKCLSHDSAGPMEWLWLPFPAVVETGCSLSVLELVYVS